MYIYLYYLHIISAICFIGFYWREITPNLLCNTRCMRLKGVALLFLAQLPNTYIQQHQSTYLGSTISRLSVSETSPMPVVITRCKRSWLRLKQCSITSCLLLAPQNIHPSTHPSAVRLSFRPQSSAQVVGSVLCNRPETMDAGLDFASPRLASPLSLTLPLSGDIRKPIPDPEFLSKSQAVPCSTQYYSRN